MLFGVWIRGFGWLKNDKGIFAAEDERVAQDAAAFFKNATVKAIDESSKDFEPIFLEAESKRKWPI